MPAASTTLTHEIPNRLEVVALEARVPWLHETCANLVKPQCSERAESDPCERACLLPADLS